MANRNLLKEAIADAKSVKEAAIANAKAALEEAFTPYLKERFSAKLAEMETEESIYEEDNQEMEETTEAKEMYKDDDRKDGGESKETKRTERMKYGKDLAETEEIDEVDLDELLAELDEEMGNDENMEENLNEDARTDAEEEGYEDGMEDEKEDEEEDEIDLEDMTEEELKDLIEDVIEDMVRAGELEAGEKFEDEEEEEDIDIDMESEEEITERKKEGYDDREDESVSARRGKEADKKQSFKDRRDDSYGKFGKRDAEAAGKASGPGKNKINKENLNEEEDMMDEAMLNEVSPEVMTMLGTVAGIVGAAGGGAALIDKLEKMAKKDPNGAAAKAYKFLTGAGGSASGGIKEDDRTDAEEEGYLDGMRDEKEDMMREIKELASTLSEVKLLNAKLLYTNKIFRAKNLNETQKVKVLEAFDKASSVKEAKLVYETLSTVKETKSVVNESVRGMASKATGMAPEKKPILEVNDQFARWQILAGIKRN
jgi:hypothetical protein